ncbi:3-dehydroquinate synthase [Candidatus Providencia siddallii]|uniref:3-dehydroquinate synthase n=1 Tax=Candidatus Providencia siddallii TaxID=1715285 RepID=A0ABM9NPC2_9GAMM
MTKYCITINDVNYPVKIIKNLYHKINIFKQLISTKQIIIITNKTIKTFYLKTIKNIFKNTVIKIDSIIIPDGEKYKNLSIINNIITKLLKKKYTKNITLLALGGGVIGDITGFVASIYKRGVQFIQVPTTLLSQVDSSIGGKVGVNHILGKNMIGTFYKPTSVIINLDFLKTLPKRELYSGFAEVIKYSIILDKAFFNWLENNINLLLQLNKEAIEYCVYKCCKLKLKIVSIDEKEKKSLRTLLNFGHTFGHAIETYMCYGTWLHGEAISVGIAIATKISELKKQITSKEANRIITLLKQAHLPIKGPFEMKPNHYITYMINDKKNINNKINLILPISIGKSIIYQNIDIKTITLAISYLK